MSKHWASEHPLVGSKNNEQPNKGRESHLVGLTGEGDFIKWASQMGFHIYAGVGGHNPVDYIALIEDKFVRVEVKRLESVQRAHNNYYYMTVTGLHEGWFDYLFVSTPQGCYWIPASECPAQTLSIKVNGDVYDRNITRPGKYEQYRIEVQR